MTGDGRKCPMCPKEEAFFAGGCIKCNKLHLNCSVPGNDATAAKPLPGYIRLGNASRAYHCLPPDTRCDASMASNTTCTEGYGGPMCMECSPNFWANGTACELCQDHDIEIHHFFLVVAIAGFVAMLVGAWLLRRATFSRLSTILKEQTMVPMALLLQHGRLSHCLDCLSLVDVLFLPITVQIDFGFRTAHLLHQPHSDSTPLPFHASAMNSLCHLFCTDAVKVNCGPFWEDCDVARPPPVLLGGKCLTLRRCSSRCQL